MRFFEKEQPEANGSCQPSLTSCSLIVQLRNRLAGKNSHLFLQKRGKRKEIIPLFKDALVKVDMARRKLVSIRPCQEKRNSESY